MLPVTGKVAGGTEGEHRKMKTLYKSLPVNVSPNGHKFVVEKWYKINGELSICNNGFHASENIIDAMNYVSAGFVAKVSVKGDSIIQDDKQCWSEMKLDKVYKWTKKDSVSLAIFATELVLENYEKKYPKDLRLREAIEAAKKVLKNDTKKNKSAAWSAAWSAARSARSARSAAESAAWSAARSARSAAESAAAARKNIFTQCHNFVIKRAKLT